MASTLRARLFAYVVTAVIGLAGGLTFAQAADPTCVERRSRSQGVENYAQDTIIHNANGQDITRHAQDDQEGRPIPRMSPIDYKSGQIRASHSGTVR
jgi:hypothetical protein